MIPLLPIVPDPVPETASSMTSVAPLAVSIVPLLVKVAPVSMVSVPPLASITPPNSLFSVRVPSLLWPIGPAPEMVS